MKYGQYISGKTKNFVNECGKHMLLPENGSVYRVSATTPSDQETRKEDAVYKKDIEKSGAVPRIEDPFFQNVEEPLSPGELGDASSPLEGLLPSGSFQSMQGGVLTNARKTSDT